MTKKNEDITDTVADSADGGNFQAYTKPWRVLQKKTVILKALYTKAVSIISEQNL